jgi:hypothetical protein
MNAYEISIWRGIRHNEKFIVNDQRTVIIHARNETEAKSKVKLAEPQHNNLDNIRIDVSKEFIYTVYKIGTVTIQPFYVYSNDRGSISVAEFKRRG